MSYEAGHNEIRKRLKDNLPVSIDPNLNVNWPNVSFTPPNPPAIWMRVNIFSGEAVQLTIGSVTNAHRFPGVIVIQIFAPLNAGDKDILAMADTVAGIFRNWCGTTVSCGTATVKAIGPDGQGWYQVNVVIRFHRDELM